MTTARSSWPPGTGDMAGRIREHDWAATPLGAIEAWPDRFRGLVELMLASPEMTSLMWGPDALQLYNDAYATGIGDRHPETLGRSALATWADVQEMFGPLLERVWSGESVTERNIPLVFSPGLPRTEGWFDLTYTPVRDAQGTIRGVYAVATETTDGVLAEREHAIAEARLRESEMRLRLALDAAQMGTFVWFPGDDRGEPDARMRALFGVPEGGTLNLSEALTTMIHPDDRDAYAHAVGRAIDPSGDGRLIAEIRVVHPDETLHWIAVTAQTTFEGEPSQMSRMYGAAADISLQKRAIDALRESDSRFRTLIQNLPDYAIFLLDPNGCITEWSEGAERISGYTSQEAVGHHLALLYPDDAVAAGEPERELAEAARVGRVERESWLMRKGGERFWGHEIVTAIHDQPGNLIGFTRISRDLTDHRQVEAKLLASEERARAIVEAATDYAIFTVDAIERIQDWFPGAEAVFGWSAEEAVGQPFAMTFTPEDRALGIPEQEFQQARQTGSAAGARWRHHKNGSRVFLESVVRARYDLDGEFLGMLKIGRDVTERRLAEQQRIEREEHIQRELRAEVASATAELRALSRRLLVVQEEERRYLARELHDEIGQMLTGLAFTLSTTSTTDGQLVEAQRIVTELTEQVRQLSMDLRPTVLDAYGLLPALRGHVDRFETRAGVKVALRFEGANRRFVAPVEIAAYRIVQEALTNLARHAQTTDAVVQLFADDRVLTVSIRDDGVGFDPSDVRGGSGLGGMRERMELLGGTLEIDTAPGAGVRITAELPLSSPPSRNPAGTDERGGAT